MQGLARPPALRRRRRVVGPCLLLPHERTAELLHQPRPEKTRQQDHQHDRVDGGLPEEAEVEADLESFAALLLKWNRVQNLVSRETAHDLWPRHVADSLQILRFLRPTDRVIVDLGSGGGFPAIPLAIASGDARRFTLVEPIAKKTSFLRTASRESTGSSKLTRAGCSPAGVVATPPATALAIDWSPFLPPKRW